MRELDSETRRMRLKFFLFLTALVVGGFGILWFWGYVHSTLRGRRDADIHPLPAEEQPFINPPMQITVDDRNIYAENDVLTFCQYTCYYYDEDKLLAEADYDKEGDLINLKCWEYDTAGNICREQIKDETDGTWTQHHIYEYDSLGRNVHEKIYWNENVVEDNYFRYTDQGRACVSYSYFNEQFDGGISPYCSYRIEYLEDEAGNLLCAFERYSLADDLVNKAWKVQWAQLNDYMMNRVQYYERTIWDADNSNWYQYVDTAEMEQVNLYEYNSETGDKNHIIQLSYEWQSDQNMFVLTVPFYRARYEDNHLLWQMSYSDSGLTHYNACQYDADGHLKAVVEYAVEEEEPHAVFCWYEYSERDRIEKYSYSVQGREFSHLFGDGGRILLSFSDEGILTGIEMTDKAGKLIEKYEFYESGEGLGRLESMYTDTNMIVGETAILEKFEEEVESYGFRAGVDLTIPKEGGE